MARSRSENRKGIHVTDENASEERNFGIGETFFDVRNQSDERKDASVQGVGAVGSRMSIRQTVLLIIVLFILVIGAIAMGTTFGR